MDQQHVGTRSYKGPVRKTTEECFFVFFTREIWAPLSDDWQNLAAPPPPLRI